MSYDVEQGVVSFMFISTAILELLKKKSEMVTHPYHFKPSLSTFNPERLAGEARRQGTW